MKKRNIVFCYLICIHFLALLFMFAGRLVLLFYNRQYAADAEFKYQWIGSAFLRGLWFDNVIACYISILPLILMPLLALSGKVGERLFTSFRYYYILLYTLVWGMIAANIPYFGYFLKPFNASVFNWKEESLTNVRMLFQEISYAPFVLMFVVWTVVFSFLVNRISKISKRAFVGLSLGTARAGWAYPFVFCALIALCLLGIRGRLGYNPIRTSQAYFCNNSFFNQLGLNPVFYFVRDVLETCRSHYRIESPTAEEAIAYVKEKSGLISNPEADLLIARNRTADGEPENLNVVIILMESMSADFLDVKVNGKEITPFLNRLTEKSYHFENIYSAGIHTNNGILASLYGMPALLGRNLMKNADVPLCQGIPSILREQGYHTMFFVSHEAQYDNTKAFVLENGIEEMYSEESYPPEKKVNCWGVADDYLFDYALETFNRKAERQSPFFAAILTTSNHPPYVVPEQFEAVSPDPQLQIVAFADDALRRFMAGAEQQDWFRHTLFVFTGDHGKLAGNASSGYDMPLSYNHIPLIFYSPALDAPKRFEQPGGQIDIFPTIMGLLKRPYQNNTLGIDLLNEKRPFIYFSSDDAVGCIDSCFFYSKNMKTEMESLYKYRESRNNLVAEEKTRADSMWTYAASMLQTAHYMFEHRETRRKN